MLTLNKKRKLFKCIRSGRIDSIRKLLSSGKINVNVLDADKKTPLFHAAYLGMYDIVELLLDEGADPDQGDKQNRTPLLVAVSNGHQDVAKLITISGADINKCTNNSGRAPLIEAAGNGDSELVELFLSKNADCNIVEKQGDSPLIAAARNGHLKIVDILISYGADINKITKAGVNAINIAYEKGHEIIVDRLKKAGAIIKTAKQVKTQYHDSTWNFSFVYPSNWTVSAMNEKSGEWHVPIALEGINEIKGRPGFMVNLTQLPMLFKNREPRNRREYIDQMILGFQDGNLPDWKLIRAENMELLEIPSTIISGTWEGEKGTIREDYITVFCEDITMLLICEAPPIYWKINKSVFDEIIGSFSIEQKGLQIDEDDAVEDLISADGDLNAEKPIDEISVHKIEDERSGTKLKAEIKLEKPDPAEVKTPEPPSAQKNITNSIGMEFVLIPAGSFSMGSQISSEEAAKRYGGEAELYTAEQPRHPVKITKPFYLQITEVSQAQWYRIMRDMPWSSRQGDSSLHGGDWPVDQISWNDAQKFISKLNQMEATNKYRLPTEAEWEYSCRAETTTPFFTGECISTDQANYNGNYPGKNCPTGEYRNKTVKVGSFQPNDWGLYDMHGNVLEWVWDWYSDYPSSSVDDPKGPDKGEKRVLRGGSYSNDARVLRSAFRVGNYPDSGHANVGFRVARDF